MVANTGPAEALSRNEATLLTSACVIRLSESSPKKAGKNSAIATARTSGPRTKSQEGRWCGRPRRPEGQPRSSARLAAGELARLGGAPTWTPRLAPGHPDTAAQHRQAHGLPPAR